MNPIKVLWAYLCTGYAPIKNRNFIDSKSVSCCGFVACLIKKVGEARTEQWLTWQLPNFPDNACKALNISKSRYRGYMAGFDGQRKAELNSEYTNGYINGVITRWVGKSFIFTSLCKSIRYLRKNGYIGG